MFIDSYERSYFSNEVKRGDLSEKFSFKSIINRVTEFDWYRSSLKTI